MKIQNCKCACCGGEEMFFVFTAINNGAIDASTTFSVKNSFRNNKYKSGMQLEPSDLRKLLGECEAISLMCLECVDECDSLEITFESHEPKLVEHANAKEIIRYMLGEEITPEDPIWSLADMYEFMLTPTMEVE